ncbi:MAG: ABC transporter substrate-binding protein [Planctomycetes bacterium]|nr:ABC transporter substrate-binding protein [Planctomycetota bacterium]
MPSLTETVCDLGVSGRLVAITRFCTEPEDLLRFVTRVGGTKNPDLQQIAELAPDLVLVNGEENRPEDIEWLRARFPIHESMPRSVPQAAAVVREIGHLLGVIDETEAVLLEIEAQLARAEVMALGSEPLRVFYPIWRQPWIGVNRDTYVHDVITRAGGHNVCAQREARYPVVPEQALAELRPDVVLLPSEPFAFTAEHRRQLLRDRAFRRSVPILMVDGRAFCWHGSRSGRGLGSVANLLRPFRTRVA